MSPRIKEIIHHLKTIKYLITVKQYSGNNKKLFDCAVCGAQNIEMLPVPGLFLGQWQRHQTIHNPFFLETMNLEHYLCSKCFSPDRDRLYALYLNDYLFTQKQKLNLLDIAPSHALRNYLKGKSNLHYRSMDLMMEDVDDRLDITNMYAYKNEQFDFFICSHVLEHIPDDIKAMKELYRITKTGGRGIVMVPINLQLDRTVENPQSIDTSYRWKYFFQDDHVRMYAKKDFIKRLTSAGFKVNQLNTFNFLKATYAQHAIFPTSVLYVVEK